MTAEGASSGVPEAPSRTLTHADPQLSILLTGLCSAAILSGDGTFSRLRETRGGDCEWGGVYGEGIRLTGPWWLRIRTPDGVDWALPETLEELAVYPTHLSSRHRTSTLGLVQEVVALPDYPAVGRRLSLEVLDGPAVSLTVESAFQPELAPVLIEGIKPYEYAVDRHDGAVRVRAFGSSLELHSLPLPAHFFLDGTPWDGRPFRGELGSVGLVHVFELAPGRPARIDWLLGGGLDSSARRPRERSAQLLADAATWGDTAGSAWRDWLARTPTLEFPDDPLLGQGYEWARAGLRSLYFSPEPGLTGLVAGYPWYAALWCRDLAWMLPAVLWLGDHEWVEAALRTVFRFQATTDLPLLGGERGELPMQIAPGPIFLYGTSDTTLYYPAIVRRHAAHSGRFDLARELLPALERIESWARARQDPRTGFVRNGGEAAGMRDAVQQFGRVHYGFDAVDTTIWDSTDRRDHAIDVQVLWAEALGALSELGSSSSLPVGGERAAEASQLRRRIAERYAWPQERYLFDSLSRDGVPVRRLRPNALRAVSAGLLDALAARAVVARAAESDLNAPWGLRTLSTRDPAYDPIAYHDGQVWPIATAWAAEAALAAGDVTRGIAWLKLIAATLRAEAGFANECYRGDRAEPFNSCFLLGFSVAPFLTTLFDTLWGLRFALGERAVDVRPRFPTRWQRASALGVRLGQGRLDLRWDRPKLTADWTGPDPLRLSSDGVSVNVPAGGRAVLDAVATPSS